MILFVDEDGNLYEPDVPPDQAIVIMLRKMSAIDAQPMERREPELGPPHNLAVARVGERATMSWDHPENEREERTHYVVGRDGVDVDGGGPWVSDPLPPETRTAAFYGLSAASGYQLWVRAFYGPQGGPTAVCGAPPYVTDLPQPAVNPEPVVEGS